MFFLRYTKSKYTYVLFLLVLLITQYNSLAITNTVSTIGTKITPLELPVLNFSSSIVNGSMDLTWMVKDIDSIDSIEIQRSDDSQNFKTFRKSKAAIIDSVTLEFNCRDKNITKRYYYYRLKYQSSEKVAYYTDGIRVKTAKIQYHILEQNNPNPFNPSATIRFEIAKRNRVILRIYNILGQNIRTLIEANLEPGAYAIEWDGKDEFGHDIAGGSYFYQILIDKYFETRRMVLLR